MTAIGEIREAASEVDAARARLQQAVDRARERGTTWAEIGEALGITKQTAWQRFGKGESS